MNSSSESGMFKAVLTDRLSQKPGGCIDAARGSLPLFAGSEERVIGRLCRVWSFYIFFEERHL
jgi:hypothetical protein